MCICACVLHAYIIYVYMCVRVVQYITCMNVWCLCCSISKYIHMYKLEHAMKFYIFDVLLFDVLLFDVYGMRVYFSTNTNI